MSQNIPFKYRLDTENVFSIRKKENLFLTVKRAQKSVYHAVNLKLFLLVVGSFSFLFLLQHADKMSTDPSVQLGYSLCSLSKPVYPCLNYNNYPPYVPSFNSSNAPIYASHILNDRTIVDHCPGRIINYFYFAKQPTIPINPKDVLGFRKVCMSTITWITLDKIESIRFKTPWTSIYPILPVNVDDISLQECFGTLAHNVVLIDNQYKLAIKCNKFVHQISN